jgi:integrase
VGCSVGIDIKELRVARLNSLSVQRLAKPGLHSDGNGLYMQISKSGARSWIFRFMIQKRARAMGLGSLELVSLADARMAALACRKQLLEGVDPIASRQSNKLRSVLETARTMTFKQCADSYIESHSPGWKNSKHADQWRNTIGTYAIPTIGALPVSAVDTGLVMKVIEPIWRDKTETASRLRNRIELVLGWATVRGYRNGDNPARWHGHLDHLLPRRSDVQKVKHFSALPYMELGNFMQKLRTLDGAAARGLEFCILTAARTSEVTGAKFSEFNLEEGLWTIPAERMKAGREHRVPLSPAAFDIVKKQLLVNCGEFLFTARPSGKPLSNNAFLSVIKKRLSYTITTHGFRSCFRDWCAEKTSHSREVVEMSLAHAIVDQTEAAYRRGDLLLKRQGLMNDWANYCGVPVHNSQVLDLVHRSV